jgi:small-conductance mechanosensitive channel
MFIATTAVAFLALFLLKIIVFAKIQAVLTRTKNTIDDSIFTVVAKVRTASLVIFAIYIGSLQLTLPQHAFTAVKVVFMFTVFLEFIGLVEAIIMAIARRSIDHTSTNIALKLLIRIVLWSIAFILLLSNMGVNVTSLVASLGIGGLAISLALQSVFQDLFASFSILIDKPFEAGDFIVLGPEHSGTVKAVGLKTTRLTTLQGEELVIPNSQLTSEKIQNFKRLKQRRIQASVGVTYQTTPQLLKEIPSLIEQCVVTAPNAEFSRAHLKTFGDSALIYEFIYIVQSNEYIDYVKAEEAINLGLIAIFAQKGIEFAYPTQTVFLQK